MSRLEYIVMRLLAARLSRADKGRLTMVATWIIVALLMAVFSRLVTKGY